MRLNPRVWGSAIGCLALAACVPPAPQPTPTPAPAPAPAPGPGAPPAPPPTPVPSSTHWMDAPLTPGDWSYSGGTARFGDAGTVRLTMRCESGGQVSLGYYGAAAAPAAMTVRAETMERAIGQVVAGSAGGPQLVGTIPARDPLLDAMAFSKGRFAVEVTGAAPLYIPAYPEVTRVIEDCR